MFKNKLFLGAGLIIVTGVSFYAGTRYSAGNQNTEFRQNGGTRQFGSGRNGGMRPVLGDILSVDESGLTVKLGNGTSKIVLLEGKTNIVKTSSGSVKDLEPGKTISVFGTANSDGSITAQNIQLNPRFGAMRERGTKEVVVTGANFSFTPTKITVNRNEKTRIVFKNNDGIHDFVVDELNLKTATIGTGKEDFVEFTPTKAGTYEFYCSVGSHRALGMKGTLEVL